MPSVLVDDPFSLDQSVLMDSYPSHQHMHHHHQLHMMQQSSSAPLYESAAAAQGSASPWASLYMPSNSNLTAELSSHRTYSHHPVGMNQSLGLNLLVNRQIQEELLAQNSESISGATAAMDVEKLMGNLSIQMDHHLCDSPRGSPGSPSTYVGSPTSHDFAALHKFLPSNNEDSWSSDDVYSSDEFRMFEFKVRRCMRGRSHDWTECPFAHPGEKARRRDPRRFHYSGTACPDFRKGNCKQGDACEYAHGVFECWLHPARYRTQPCKDGRNCRRRVCFFAHTPEQLRLLPAAQAATGSSSSSSPKKQSMSNSQLVHKSCLSGSSAGSGSGSFGYEAMDSGGYGGSPLGKIQYHATPSHITSPTSTLIGLSQSPPPLSPPLSPPVSPPMSPSSPKSWHHSLSVAAARGSLLQSVSQGHAGSNLSASLNQNLTQNQHSMAAAAAAAIAVAGSSPRRQQIHLDVLGGSTAGSYASTVGSYGSGAGSYVSMDRRLQNPHSAPSSPVGSSKPMNDLVAALQQLELQGAPPLWLQAQMAQLAQSSCSSNSNTAAQYSSGPSPLRHSSMPVTPNKARWDIGEMWEMDVSEEEPVARVESGRDLRAKIYGKLNRENLVDGSSNSDSPDLGWVNELVKE